MGGDTNHVLWGSHFNHFTVYRIPWKLEAIFQIIKSTKYFVFSSMIRISQVSQNCIAIASILHFPGHISKDTFCFLYVGLSVHIVIPQRLSRAWLGLMCPSTSLPLVSVRKHPDLGLTEMSNFILFFLVKWRGVSNWVREDLEKWPAENNNNSD